MLLDCVFWRIFALVDIFIYVFFVPFPSEKNMEMKKKKQLKSLGNQLTAKSLSKQVFLDSHFIAKRQLIWNLNYLSSETSCLYQLSFQSKFFLFWHVLMQWFFNVISSFCMTKWEFVEYDKQRQKKFYFFHSFFIFFRFEKGKIPIDDKNTRLNEYKKYIYLELWRRSTSKMLYLINHQ